MNSLSTIEQTNLQQYWGVIRQLDPELYLIKIALEETGINPMILPRIIRSMSNLNVGTGYGKVQIFMQARVITSIKGEENDNINLSIVSEESE